MTPHNSVKNKIVEVMQSFSFGWRTTSLSTQIVGDRYAYE